MLKCTVTIYFFFKLSYSTKLCIIKLCYYHLTVLDLVSFSTVMSQHHVCNVVISFNSNERLTFTMEIFTLQKETLTTER